MKSLTEVAQDEAWKDLASSPVRRMLLGRKRCDRLVTLAIKHMPLGPLGMDADGRRIITRRVLGAYGEPCSSVFVSFVLSWAVSAIVKALIRRWWIK
jgi:hypothetical protein